MLLTPLPDIPLVRPGDDLTELIWASCKRANLALQEGDILVVAQKVVSKAEGRLVHLQEVTPSPAALELAARSQKDPRLVTLILAEAREVLRVRPGLIVVEHRQGFVCANAGIDHSNVGEDDDLVLLLPSDADASARALRAGIQAATGADIAIIINDSHGRAWRLGTVGVAIGVAGLLPLADKRGSEDLFRHPLQVTVLGIADEIAAAASLLQGGAAESSPIIHLRGVPYPPGEGHLRDLLRPHELDLFR